MLIFFALLMTVFMLYKNVKGYKNFFKTNEDIETEFNKVFTEAHYESTKGILYVLTLMIAGFFMLVELLYIGLTASVIGTPFMYLFGLALFFIGTFKTISSMLKGLKKKKLRLGFLYKVAIPLKTVYIIFFLIQFFTR